MAGCNQEGILEISLGKAKVNIADKTMLIT